MIVGAHNADQKVDLSLVSARHFDDTMFNDPFETNLVNAELQTDLYVPNSYPVHGRILTLWFEKHVHNRGSIPGQPVVMHSRFVALPLYVMALPKLDGQQRMRSNVIFHLDFETS